MQKQTNQIVIVPNRLLNYKYSSLIINKTAQQQFFFKSEMALCVPQCAFEGDLKKFFSFFVSLTYQVFSFV